MSSQTPPNPWFNPIDFNPNFFTSSTGYVTLTFANSTYLKRIGSPISSAILTTFSNSILIGNTVYLTSSITTGGTNASFVAHNSGSSQMVLQNNATNGSVAIYSRDDTNSLKIPFTVSASTTTNSGLSGSVFECAMFGRNDTTANSFNGTLNYTRHPIGWTISATKAIAIPTSNVAVEIIAFGTPTTVFNNLSNGVWRIGVTCNNNVLGAMTFVQLYYGTLTGATCINGTIGNTNPTSIFHQTTAGLTNMGISYPEIIIRTTGNGTIGLQIYWLCSYTVQPTITFNMWAIKVA